MKGKKIKLSEEIVLKAKGCYRLYRSDESYDDYLVSRISDRKCKNASFFLMNQFYCCTHLVSNLDELVQIFFNYKYKEIQEISLSEFSKTAASTASNLGIWDYNRSVNNTITVKS